MSLEEEIALRLSQRYVIAAFPAPREVHRMGESAAYTNLAREVIRLMEWSRQKCDWRLKQYPATNSPPMPLTLPPEDWKP